MITVSTATTRREFITLLGGAAAAWPLAARAQQPAKVPTIGFLGAARLRLERHGSAAFVQRLRELGWIEGRTVAIEYRWAEGRAERFAEIAAEFVRLKVDVIVTAGTARAVAAKQATSVIPIVFAAGERPGRQRPGRVSWRDRAATSPACRTRRADLAGKRLELLREVAPGLRRLAIMANAGYPAVVLEMGEVEAAARTLGLEIAATRNPASGGYRARLRGAQEAAQRRFMSWADPLVIANRIRINTFALAARLPTMYSSPRVRRSRRSDVLWGKLPGPVPARRRLCR